MIWCMQKRQYFKISRMMMVLTDEDLTDRAERFIRRVATSHDVSMLQPNPLVMLYYDGIYQPYDDEDLACLTIKQSDRDRFVRIVVQDPRCLLSEEDIRMFLCNYCLQDCNLEFTSLVLTNPWIANRINDAVVSVWSGINLVVKQSEATAFPGTVARKATAVTFLEFMFLVCDPKHGNFLAMAELMMNAAGTMRNTLEKAQTLYGENRPAFPVATAGHIDGLFAAAFDRADIDELQAIGLGLK